jgi:hypothetical protein
MSEAIGNMRVPEEIAEVLTALREPLNWKVILTEFLYKSYKDSKLSKRLEKGDIASEVWYSLHTHGRT